MIRRTCLVAGDATINVVGLVASSAAEDSAGRNIGVFTVMQARGNIGTGLSSATKAWSAMPSLSVNRSATRYHR